MPVATTDVAVPRALQTDRPSRRWTTGWRLALVFAALAVATHLPSLLRTEVLNPDEAYLATEAEVLLDGGKLYTDVVDRKPPLLPELYANTFRLTGSDSLLSVRVLALGAHVATALLLAAMARRRWGERAALVAGACYLVSAGGLVLEDSQAATFGVFMLPTAVAGVWLAERGRLAGAGIAIAASAMTKQVAATTLLPAALAAWRHDRRRGVLLLGAWFVLPIVAVASYYGWTAFWFWVVTGTGGYLDASGSWGVAAGRALSSTAIFVGGNLAAAVLLVVAARRWRTEVDLWLWLAAAAIGVIAGFRFYGHYYLQLMPPLALLAAGAFERIAPAVQRRAVAVAAAGAVVFFAIQITSHPPLLRPYDSIAAAVRAHTTEGERVFVWGQLPQVYWAADRLPSSRFLTAEPLSGFSGGRDHDGVGQAAAIDRGWERLLDDFRAHPPAVVVDTSALVVGTDAKWSLAIPRYPALAGYLAAAYQPVDYVDGAVIYARRR